jgi:hypothetical protein
MLHVSHQMGGATRQSRAAIKSKKNHISPGAPATGNPRNVREI